MTEHPILFSATMIRAILEGRKAQTRRVVKFKNTFLKGLPGQLQEHREMKACYPMPRGGFVFWSDEVGKEFSDYAYPNDGGGCLCPYGKIGERLWVRETWGVHPFLNGIKPSDLDEGVARRSLTYRADIPENDSQQSHFAWRPSIFMPRWASRIVLDVVNIRVERVQGISHNDACVEGAPSEPKLNNYGTGSIYVDWYAELWDEINTKRGFGWNVNPFVWVTEFERAR